MPIELPALASSAADDALPIYKLLVSSVRDYAIFLLDQRGNVRTWNVGAQNAKQYTQDEIVGKNFSLFYTPEDLAVDLPAKLLKIALERGRVEDEGWRVRKDGSRFWADVVLTAIFDEEGNHLGFAKVTRDLTEKRDLVRQREEALAASTAKSAFLANMSHELRTPLTAILGYAEMIEELSGDLDPETLKEHVGKILYSGRHLMSIISDILDLSKVEAGRLDLHFSQVNLRQLLAEVMDNLAPVASTNGNKLELVVSDSMPLVNTDHTRLRQILYNLISNAIKFTHNGTIQVSARVEKCENAEYVCIAVADTGVGLSPEELAIVFDRFSQVEAHVPTYNRGGTGLGLAICKMLVSALGGTLEAESVRGEGSTFSICLPFLGKG